MIELIGEEAINPSRTIPLSTMLSLAICCLCYVGVSSSITLMQPYFLIDVHSPLPYAFQYVGVNWVGTIVSIGAMCAMLTGYDFLFRENYQNFNRQNRLKYMTSIYLNDLASFISVNCNNKSLNKCYDRTAI